VGTVASADNAGPGGMETLSWGGASFDDDSGTYELIVESSSGFDCMIPYILMVEGSG
jgi:hypothetical protein